MNRVRHSENERGALRQDGEEVVCHFDHSEERAEWRNLAVSYVSNKQQDFSTTKFVETNFSARNDTLHQQGATVTEESPKFQRTPS